MASKYPCIAEQALGEMGLEARVIKLHGNAELAPLVGLADVVLDLVSTGSTLRANGLEVIAELGWVSGRLIANPASLRLKGGAIRRLVEGLREAMKGGDRCCG